MSDPVSWLLAYLLIGATLWALHDPAAFISFALSRYCQRHGRPPPRGYAVTATVAFIVLWPVFVVSRTMALLGRLR